MTEVTGNQIAALLLPTAVMLVSAYDVAGEPCVATIAWAMPISHEPSLVAVSIRPGGRTSTAMAESEAFVVGTLPADECGARIALVCGKKRGVEDRFSEAGITAVAAERVHAPRVKQAVSWIECELVEHRPCGDHELFIGRTVLARTRAGLDEAGAVVPEPVLVMGQRGSFGTLAKM